MLARDLQYIAGHSSVVVRMRFTRTSTREGRDLRAAVAVALILTLYTAFIHLVDVARD